MPEKIEQSCPLLSNRCLEGNCVFWTIYYEGTEHYVNCALVVAAQALKEIAESLKK